MQQVAQSSPIPHLQDLVTRLCRSLVDHPSAVEVVVLTGRTFTCFEVICAQGDVCYLVGQQGATADALRGLVSRLGEAWDLTLRIHVPDHRYTHRLPRRPTTRPAPPAVEQDGALVQELLRAIVREPDRSLVVETAKLSQGAQFFVEGTPDQVARLVGRGRVTLGHLEAIVAAIGGSHGKVYKLFISPQRGSPDVAVRRARSGT